MQAIKINDLPVELLQYIFVLVCYQKRTDINARSILIQTCQAWRAIAFSISKLWTEMNVIRYSSESFESVSRRAIREVKHSGSLSLDVTWEVPFYHMDSSELYVTAFCPLLETASSRRWKSLKLLRFEQVFEGMFMDGFQSLESLEILIPRESALAPLQLIRDTAPSLTTLHLPYYVQKYPNHISDIVKRISTLILGAPDKILSLPPSITHLEIPMLFGESSLTSVTYLVLDYASVDDLIMLHLPNLEALEIRLVLDIMDVTFQLRLPKLREFVFMGENFFASTFLVTPNLQTLEFANDDMQIQEASEAVGEMMEYNHWNLPATNVILRLRLIPETICTFLNYAPNIEHLTILLDDPRHNWGSLLDILLQSSVDNHKRDRWDYCPNLVSITLMLDWLQTDTVVWTEFAMNVIEARRVGPMKSVLCVWDDGNEIRITF